MGDMKSMFYRIGLIKKTKRLPFILRSYTKTAVLKRCTKV